MKNCRHFFLCAWIFLGLCFPVKQSIFAAGSATSRMVLDANCTNAGVIVDISDLYFEGVTSTDDAQTISGSRSQGIFSSNYYGAVPFHGIVVEDANANCGLPSESSIVTPAWYVTLSTDMLSGADESQQYMLEPNGHYDEQFDYETYKSYIHMEVDTTDSITALTGNGAHQLVDEQVVFAHDSFGVDFLEKNLMERNAIQGDQRKGLFQIDPEIRLTLPGNFPDVTYEGALYINLYAKASEVIVDSGSDPDSSTGSTISGDVQTGDTQTGSASTGDGLRDISIFHEFGIWNNMRRHILQLEPEFMQDYFKDLLEILAAKYEAGIYDKKYTRKRLQAIWKVVRRY